MSKFFGSWGRLLMICLIVAAVVGLQALVASETSVDRRNVACTGDSVAASGKGLTLSLTCEGYKERRYSGEWVMIQQRANAGKPIQVVCLTRRFTSGAACVPKA
jgi:hypothetical protein